MSGVHVEDLLIDLPVYYWFDKSMKKKGVLTEYMDFRNQEYAKILTHGSTRCIYWKSMLLFLSEHFADSRFERLHTDFENPLTELALLFSFLFLEMYQSPGGFSCWFTGDQGWKVCMRCKRTWWMVVVRDVKSSLGSIPTNSLKCCTAKTFWFPTSRGREVLGSNAGHQLGYWGV